MSWCGRTDRVRRLARGEIVAECVAVPLAEDGPPFKVHHLFLGASDEMAGASLGRESVETPPRLRRSGGRAVATDDGRGNPCPCAASRSGAADGGPTSSGRSSPVRPDSRKRLGKLVPMGLVDPTAIAGCAEFVGLVEDHEVVGKRPGIGERCESRRAPDRVQRHYGQVASRSCEWISRARVRAGHDAELEPEEGSKLPLPVAHQAGGRDHQYATDSPRMSISRT